VGTILSVKIHFFSPLQPYIENRPYIEANGLTIGECLKNIIKEYPAVKKELFSRNGRLLGRIGVYINGQNAHPGELARPVKDGDEISIVWVYAGG
jgi:molybdopterin converting factor small subunit